MIKNKSIKPLLFSLIGVLCFFQSFAQQVTLVGLCLDINNTPIEGVYVYNSKNSKVTVTNKDGYYLIPLLSEKVEITFTHVGYKTQKLIIENIGLSNSLVDTIEQTTILKTKITPIEEVEVNALLNYKIVHPSYRKSYLIDFEYENEVFYILKKSNKTHYLSLYNKDFSLIKTAELSTLPKKIFKDCIGNIHLIGDNDVQQIIYNKEELTLMVIPLAKQTFELQLENCALQTNNLLIYKFLTEHNKRVRFNYIDTQDKTSGLLYELYDLEAADNAQYYYNKIVRNYNMVTSSAYKDAIRRNNELNAANERSDLLVSVIEGLNLLEFGFKIENVNDYFVFDKEIIAAITYYNTITYPIRSSICASNDSIYIFDFFNKRALIFKGKEMVKSLPLQFKPTKNYRYEVISDYSKAHLYKIDYKNPVSIAKINKQTMKLEKEVILGFEELTKIIIINNSIYALGRKNDVFRELFLIQNF